jgi:EpsI family protein
MARLRRRLHPDVLLDATPAPDAAPTERGAGANGGLTMTMTLRLVILACGFFASAAYVTHAMEPEPTPLRQPFSAMDTQLGRWSGRAAPKITDDVLAVLGVDDFVNRIYQASPSELVSLYIGYYESQRDGDSIHSPMNCLPGAGWQPVETGYVDVAVPGRDVPITVKRVVIEKGLDRQVVLYWYQSHGRVVGNEYWSKALMIYDAVRLNRSDAALVRVISPVGRLEHGNEPADARLTDFVRALFRQLDQHLPA